MVRMSRSQHPWWQVFLRLWLPPVDPWIEVPVT